MEYIDWIDECAPLLNLIKCLKLTSMSNVNFNVFITAALQVFT